MKETFWLEDQERDVNEFESSVLHCIISTSGKKTPKPLAKGMHRQKCNDLIHMDLLFIGKSHMENMKYLLLLQEYLSGNAC